ncbi:MAG: SH3 domain-containing protein [Acidobacteria bacterium]|nr:SH3 domain-containing protein [Acidobacteriota bacterium]MBV9478856.1 SH3 domain-containing protein [Acidobacteriota bacterium]
MKHVVLALLAFAALACSQEQPAVTGTVDTREPIRVSYVGAPELPVHAKADDQSEVIATYQNGEAMSVLSEKGDWVEVRSGDGSGWAHKTDLTTAEAKRSAEENPEPKFRIMPLPVSAPGAHGEVYIEADVNTDGDVTATRLISNSTGSTALAAQNENALKSAKFYPIIVRNERRAFKYYHRVSY